MRDILIDRYYESRGCGPLKRRPECPGESRRDRVVLEVKVPPDLWTLFTREADARRVTQSGHMEDILTERYQGYHSEADAQGVTQSGHMEDILTQGYQGYRWRQQGEMGVVPRKSA